MKSSTLKDLAASDPQIRQSVLERQGLSYEQADKLNVTYIQGDIQWGNDARDSRYVTVALITEEPIRVTMMGLGVALKAPHDSPSEVGRRLSLARAVRYVKRIGYRL